MTVCRFTILWDRTLQLWKALFIFCCNDHKVNIRNTELTLARVKLFQPYTDSPAHRAETDRKILCHNMWQKAWQFRALCTLPAVRSQIQICSYYHLDVLRCVSSCSLCNSDSIVKLLHCRSSRVGGRFSLELNSIPIIPPIMHVPANTRTIDTPREALTFLFSVCSAGTSLNRKDFSIIFVGNYLETHS